MGLRIEALLAQQLERKAQEEQRRLAQQRHAEEVFSNISDEQKGRAHQLGLTDQAHNSLLSDPEKYRKYIALINQNA